MKILIVMLCLFLTGCATVPPRDALYGLPNELRTAIGNNPIVSGAGNRNSVGTRYGSPERGFLNVNSNRGYTNTEYSGTNGHGWTVNSSNGRITGWSMW